MINFSTKAMLLKKKKKELCGIYLRQSEFHVDAYLQDIQLMCMFKMADKWQKKVAKDFGLKTHRELNFHFTF